MRRKVVLNENNRATYLDQTQAIMCKNVWPKVSSAHTINHTHVCMRLHASPEKGLECVEGISPPHMVTPFKIFFLNSSFPIIPLDQLKYWFGLVNTDLDWLNDKQDETISV